MNAETLLKNNRKRFFLRIILPAILAVSLFVLSFFVIIIPSFEENSMDRKREMICELTNSAWSILSKYEKEESDSLLTRENAQQKAISEIKHLRYGAEMKDYFWVTDMRPYMIMHPYRSDLNGKSLGDFKDPHGKKLFVEFVNVVKKSDEGYVDYMWQWKDDSTRIVPKLSFVKVFKPWGWIIGTGIYIEDVKEEISKMENRLVKISAIIILIIVALLIILMRQSNRIEKSRLKAEAELNHSRERYRALAEASTEGSLMLVEGGIFANKFMLDMLGYSEEEIKAVDISKIISDERCIKLINEYKNLSENTSAPQQTETRLNGRDGRSTEVMINISGISLAGKSAVILITKNLERKISGGENEGERQKLMSLSESFRIGVFRCILARRSMFVEANSSAAAIFGFRIKDDLFKTNIEKLFADSGERRSFVKELIRNNIVTKKVLKITRKDETSAYIRVSLKVESEPEGGNKYCSGIVEEITDYQLAEISKGDIMKDLLFSQSVSNIPVKELANEPVVCDINTSVVKAVALMDANRCDSLVVKAPDGGFAGIVTEKDIAGRAVVEGFDINEPVYKIMSSPLVSVSENALLFEAFFVMQSKNVSHLMVKNNSGEIKYIISRSGLFGVQRYTPAMLLKKIESAQSVNDLVMVQALLKQIIRNYINIGASPYYITRIISSVSDAIIEKLNVFAQEELGAPPVSYSYITLGSVGREEQTLATDQDNAIIFEDVPPEQEQQVREYFLKMGEKISNRLDRIGYSFCRGNIMAKNPEYCQPLSKWKKYFAGWITTIDPKDLLDVNIFFDFRFSYGNREITQNLKDYMQSILKQNSLIFYHLAINTLSLKPPINFFGNIIKESGNEHSDSFDIKKAIMPIVGFARVYALKHNIDESNTLKRALKMAENNIILRSEYDMICQMYHYLMNLRFRHQTGLLEENKTADNYIDPSKLSELDQAILKKIFSQINNLLTKLSYDFKGTQA